MNPIPSTWRITQAVVWLALLLALPVSRAKAEDQTRLVPEAPARVIAVPLRSAAIVAWVLPENADEAPPITGYTISAFDSNTPHAIAVTAKARAAGALVHGLAAGHCYSFRVHASNAAGIGQESEASEAICLPAAVGDIKLAMTAPATGKPGSELTFTVMVSNEGPADAALVNVVDMLPAALASFTTTQGVCQGAVGGNNFGCNLGALPSGASATVTVSVMMGNTDITNTAWASAFDNAGAALPDPLPANNAGSATVSVQP